MVCFVWMGVVVYIIIFDVMSGMDSWNSGLLDQGVIYDLIFNEEGEYFYYCIFYGGFGGIGMVGNIIVCKMCNNGQGLVNVLFNVFDGSVFGYQVFVDSEFVAGLFFYDNFMGVNNVLIEVFGDVSIYVLMIQDFEIDFCVVSIVFEVFDCLEICLIE